MQLSDLFAALENLREHSGALVTAYENDDDVGDMKARAVEIRDRAQKLVDVFDATNEGLGLL